MIVEEVEEVWLIGVERALQGSAKDGALLFSAYITAIRLSVDVLLFQIFMRLSHDNIISAVFLSSLKIHKCGWDKFSTSSKNPKWAAQSKITHVKNIGAVIRKFFH